MGAKLNAMRTKALVIAAAQIAGLTAAAVGVAMTLGVGSAMIAAGVATVLLALAAEW